MSLHNKKTKDLVLAIDQGTTGTTALLVDRRLQVLASKNLEYKQHYPKPGWVEHDLEDIWKSTLQTIKAVVKDKKTALRIAAIGITNQRETSCFWSRSTGKALARAIVWQDRRTTDICEKLKSEGQESLFQLRTGLFLDPYFSGTKVKWILENNPKVKAARDKKDLCFGTIDSYLIHKLTGGDRNSIHVTEYSNASRTLFLNLKNLSWDEELLEILSVPKHILPELKDSDALFGKIRNVPGLPDGIPIHGVLGDQQAALLGQACTEKGMAKCTYGTGSFILMNTGERIPTSQHKLLATIAWKIKGKTSFALEGGAFTAGAAVQWVRDGLKIIKKSSDIEVLAKTVTDSQGVVFVPGFVGLGAPHWKPDVRASFFGITRGTTQGHIARAVLEGIAFMNHDILRAMEKDLGESLISLNVDGGACKNNLLMQFQADVLNVKLNRPQMVETTSLGAVFAAGLGVGLWKDFSEIKKTWKVDKIFKPVMASSAKAEYLKNWNSAIQRLS